MSYPRVVRSLVIEDDSDVVQTYRELFDEFEADGLPVAKPVIAQCLNDAQVELARDGILHLVILDLRLPEDRGGASDEASARGLELLGQIERRDRYPVPALVIATGDLNRANPLDAVRRSLEENFFYGRLIRKGLALANDLKEAIAATLRYCEFGVHILPNVDEAFPPISPREEDLLRRSGLAQGAVGVDLRWWSAERRDAGGVVGRDWVKVLQGRYLLGGDVGDSRPRFFKFESRENGEKSRSGAQLLAQKLNHTSVVRALASANRS